MVKPAHAGQVGTVQGALHGVLARMDPDGQLKAIRQRLRVLRQRSAHAGELSARSAEVLLPPRNLPQIECSL